MVKYLSNLTRRTMIKLGRTRMIPMKTQQKGSVLWSLSNLGPTKSNPILHSCKLSESKMATCCRQITGRTTKGYLNSRFRGPTKKCKKRKGTTFQNDEQERLGRIKLVAKTFLIIDSVNNLRRPLLIFPSRRSQVSFCGLQSGWRSLIYLEV